MTPVGSERPLPSPPASQTRPLPPSLEPLRTRPDGAALFCDFDGTLAEIVEEPSAARPLAGVPDLLARLAGRLALVAVVSGRPVAFLDDVLERPAGVHLFGVYGMEELTPEGKLVVDPRAAAWRSDVETAAGVLTASAPPGVVVEDKGISVTLHWRRAPEAEVWVREAVAAASERSGLVVQRGRMALELRPPTDSNKGDVVRRLGAGHRTVIYFGDDIGDLAAFEAVGALALTGASVVRVAVVDEGTPEALRSAGEILANGPSEVVAWLRDIAGG